MKKPALGGEIVLADRSAISRARHPAVRQEVAAALNARQIVTCSVVTREVIYSARDRQELEDLEATQAMLRDIPMTDSIHRAALTAVREWHDVGQVVTASRFPTS